MSELCGWRIPNIFDLKYVSGTSSARHEIVVVVVVRIYQCGFFFGESDKQKCSKATWRVANTYTHEARFASLAADMLPPQQITDNGQLLRGDNAPICLIRPSGYSHDWALGRGWLKPQRKHAEHAQKANRQMQSGNTARTSGDKAPSPADKPLCWVDWGRGLDSGKARREKTKHRYCIIVYTIRDNSDQCICRNLYKTFHKMNKP